MIKIFDLNTMTLEEILDRTEEETVDVTNIVADIIDTVRQKGDQALLEYAKKFDKADLNNLVVTQEEIDEALAQIDPYFIETLNQARDNIQLYHEKQLRSGYEIQKEDGWYRLPYTDGAFPEDALVILPNLQIEHRFPLDRHFAPLKPGNYRILLDGVLYREDGTAEKQYLLLAFTVTKDGKLLP